MQINPINTIIYHTPPLKEYIILTQVILTIPNTRMNQKNLSIPTTQNMQFFFIDTCNSNYIQPHNVKVLLDYDTPTYLQRICREDEIDGASQFPIDAPK